MICISKTARTLRVLAKGLPPSKNLGKNRVKPRRTHTNHGSLGGGGVKNSNNMGGFSLRPRGFSIRHRETEFFLGGTPKKNPHGNGKTSHIAWVFLLKPRNSPTRPVVKPSHNKRTLGRKERERRRKVDGLRPMELPTTSSTCV